MSAVTTCITVEEFDALNLPEDQRWELHDREVVEMTFPVFVHGEIQDRIVAVLAPQLPGARIMTE